MIGTQRRPSAQRRGAGRRAGVSTALACRSIKPSTSSAWVRLAYAWHVIHYLVGKGKQLRWDVETEGHCDMSHGVSQHMVSQAVVARKICLSKA
jgi:hypothetical protein